jgi:hypothetical protein
MQRWLRGIVRERDYNSAQDLRRNSAQDLRRERAAARPKARGRIQKGSYEDSSICSICEPPEFRYCACRIF